MSRNSPKTLSEGDADSYCDSYYPNIITNYPYNRNLEGGPYGDIPPDPNRVIYNDYVVFMLHHNDCSSDDSDNENSDNERDLYSLRNEYIQKLNIVRRRLNLTEISDGGDQYFNTCFEKKCTITEIIDEEDDKVNEVVENDQPHCSSPPLSPQPPKPPTDPNTTPQQEYSNIEYFKLEPVDQKTKETSRNTSSSIEIETIHPFSLCYNKIETESITNLLELEYNPPKKKSCFRLKTPKVPSASESNIPYHTKVSLHDGLFKKPSDHQLKEKSFDEPISKSYLEQFTVTREIQCDEEDLDKICTKCDKKAVDKQKVNKTPKSKPKFNKTNKKIRNLYPEVVVKYESKKKYTETSSAEPGYDDMKNVKNVTKATNVNKNVNTVTNPNLTLASRTAASSSAGYDDVKYVTNVNNVKKATFTISSHTETSSSAGYDDVKYVKNVTNVNRSPNAPTRYSNPTKYDDVKNIRTVKNAANVNTVKSPNVSLPNFIDDSSRESYSTVSTNTIVLKKSPVGKKRRKLAKHNPFKSEHVWNNLRELNSKGQGDVPKKCAEDVRVKDGRNVLVQYVSYRKEKKRAKTSPIKMKSSLGPVILHNYDKKQNVNETFYFFNSTSEEEKYVKELCHGNFDVINDSEDSDRRKPWSFFSCFESIFSIFRRSKRNES